MYEPISGKYLSTFSYTLGQELSVAQERIHELKIAKTAARLSLVEANGEINPLEAEIKEMVFYAAKVGLKAARQIRNQIRNEMGMNRNGEPYLLVPDYLPENE
jgi:hypothetical protein